MLNTRRQLRSTEGDVLRVDAVETGTDLRPEAMAAVIGERLKFSLVGLQSFFFARWDAGLFDLMVVAAAVEFCDVIQKRPALGWARWFDVHVAVHEPTHWSRPEVRASLEDALNFLTGDIWSFSFSRRRKAEPAARQQSLPLPHNAAMIMPYSEGLDSLAVHALTVAREPGELVRVRLGPGGVDRKTRSKDRRPFTAVPFWVGVPERVESSARSRGFKFAIITGIAAIMSDLSRIVVTESGQGALGPLLVTSGQAYPDCRVHPAFTRRVERLFQVLAGKALRYEYPRLWSTKGETLAEAARLPVAPDWTKTRSCWQGARQVSVDGVRRQCGVCAACMLRRLSMHAAGLGESAHTYVWEALETADFRAGAAANFARHTNALDQYGIAGVLHLDHLADLATSDLHRNRVRRIARLTADAMGDDVDVVETSLYGLLGRHAAEWQRFVTALGPQSFVARYAASVRHE